MDNGKNKIITKKIKVYGIVQGVGFRPLVYHIAKKWNVKGYVRNVGGYVDIMVHAEKESVEGFFKELRDLQSTGVEIVKIEVDEIELEEIKVQEIETEINIVKENDIEENECEEIKDRQNQISDFVIITSGNSDEVAILPPDLPVCRVCMEELKDSSNRRYGNPFISCMSCGPRYTIMERVPYDRDTTTMVDFKMCTVCEQEYSSPDTRRFHAQTISCNDCGPYLIYQDNNSKSNDNLVQRQRVDKCISSDKRMHNEKSQIDESAQDKLLNKELIGHQYDNEEALLKVFSIIKNGGIVAVKGIGGYHFVCSPYNEATVQNLRKLKGREEKPFAVMFPDISAVEDFCIVSEEEKALLLTNARPIALLYMHEDTMAPSTNKGSIYCGAFLPYTPLQILLTRECGALIMTSANLSNQPIIKADDEMCSLKSPYLNGVLYNTRKIVRTVDDSVAKIIDGKPQLIRRSRGFVPYPVFLPKKIEDANHAIFGAGGDLKAALCLYKSGNAIVSQYLGDLEELNNMEEYKKAYGDLASLLKIAPDLVVCDMHPNYHSVRFAKELGLPLISVQHHQAHIASVMAEHDLHEKVIGIAFDGTGYGTDGNIWGGEFLVCEGTHFTREAHLKYTPMIGGDQSMKDAKKTAACFLMHYKLSEYVRDERKDLIRSLLELGINTILSSSMGRLFDAVSSILGIGQENSYEGECAALLEKEAILAKRDLIKPAKLQLPITKNDGIIELDPAPLLSDLCELRAVCSTRALALGFHYSLAESIGVICEILRNKHKCNIVVISGGVFQNSVLTEKTYQVLREKDFRVYSNLSVPPNDGGISLGQVYLGKEYIENSKVSMELFKQL